MLLVRVVPGRGGNVGMTQKVGCRVYSVLRCHQSPQLLSQLVDGLVGGDAPAPEPFIQKIEVRFTAIIGQFRIRLRRPMGCDHKRRMALLVQFFKLGHHLGINGDDRLALV